jgi:outer membrane protein with beta-barrel domain
MYRFPVLAIVLICSAYLGMAQNKFSVAAGGNFSSVSSINSTNPNGTLGITGGVAYKMYMNDLGWFVKPGLFYSQEGWSRQRLNYLNLPVILGFDFTEDFNFNVGLQYGYLVGGINDPDNLIDRNNIAFLFGFEFYPSETWEVGIRFANGVKNIIKKPDAFVVKDARTYSIQLYFSFNFKNKNK